MFLLKSKPYGQEVEKMKALVTDPTSEEGLKILSEKGIKYDYCPKITRAEFLEKVGEYDAILVRGATKVDREVFERGKSLKVVGRIGVGLDNIDLETAGARGVQVVNAADAPANSVAELTIGLMISLVRNIPLGNSLMKKGKYAKKECFGITLASKNLGVIGFGNIGSRVGKIASAMGMNVLAYDVAKWKILKSGVSAKNVDLEELLTNSDVITVHVPLIPQTKGLIGKKEVKKMKEGVYLINAARLHIFERNAIIEGLESEKIAGVAVDSDKKLDDPFVKELTKSEKCIITPHIGSQTRLTQQLAAKVTSSRVAKVLTS